MARPAVPESQRRKHQVNIWLSDAELGQLERRKDELKSSGLTVSNASVLRDLALHPDTVRRTRIERYRRDVYRQLRGIATNLNQMTHLAHQAGQIEAASTIQDEVARVQGLIRNLTRDVRSLEADEPERRAARERIRKAKHQTPLEAFLDATQRLVAVANAIADGQTHHVTEGELLPLATAYKEAVAGLAAAPLLHEEIRHNRPYLEHVHAQAQTLIAVARRAHLELVASRLSSTSSKLRSRFLT